jgi:hypothetical protein
MLSEAGITGDSERMQQYLERRFGCHPLVVGVVCGLVRNNLRARGNFDRWVDDPDGGAAVNLADPDIVQRRTHILKLAFGGLEARTRELLSRIAMIANAVGLDVLEVLNPTRPPHPEEVEAPTPPEPAYDYRVQRLREELAAATAPDQHAALERQIADHLRKQQDNYQIAQQAYAEYQSSHAQLARLGCGSCRTALAELRID